MPASEGIPLIQQAIEKENEEKAWELWVSLVPHMDQAHFVSFDQFISDLRSETNKQESSLLNPEDIIAKAERIKGADQAGR